MSYATPHSAHEFMKAAAIAVVHHYYLALRPKTKTIKSQILIEKGEIDFNSRLALFFGPEASISAQGKKGVDLHLESPILDVELKYLRKKPRQNQPVNSWAGVMKDWRWLMGLVNENGNVFRQSAWVVILPSVELFDFHSDFQVPGNQQQNQQIPKATFAPFVELVEPDPVSPGHLRYCQGKWGRDVLLQKAGTKVLIRREIVGNPKHPVWCMIFSRVGSKLAKSLEQLPRHEF